MIKISNDLAKQLMESSDWSGQKDVKTKLSESTETQEEVVEEVVEEATEEGITEEDAAALMEAIQNGDVHVCPLCETILAEELSDEIVENHIEFVAGILSEDVSDEDSEDDEK